MGYRNAKNIRRSEYSMVDSGVGGGLMSRLGDDS